MGVFLSILVPVHNVAPYLADFLDSYQDGFEATVEMIFWDDASTDHSLAVIQQWSKGNIKSDIKFFQHKTNQGITKTRQNLLEQAQGEYVWYVDPDDMLNNNAISIVCQTLSRHQPDVLLFDYQIFDDETRIIKKQEKLLFQSDGVKKSNKNNGLYHLAIQDNKHYFWNKVFKRTVVENVEVQAMPVYEDVGYVPTWLFYCHDYFYLNRALLTYRLRSGSLSHRKDSTQIYAVYAYLEQAAFCLKHIGEGKTYFYLLYKAYTHYYRLQRSARADSNELNDASVFPSLKDVNIHKLPMSGWCLVGKLLKSGMIDKMLKLFFILITQAKSSSN